MKLKMPKPKIRNPFRAKRKTQTVVTFTPHQLEIQKTWEVLYGQLIHERIKASRDKHRKQKG